MATLLKHLTHSHLPRPKLCGTLPGITVLKIWRSCNTISYTAANTTTNNTKDRMIHHQSIQTLHFFYPTNHTRHNTAHSPHTHSSKRLRQALEGRTACRSRSVGHEGVDCAGAEATDSRANHAMLPVADFITTFVLVIFLTRIAWHVDNDSKRKLPRYIWTLLRQCFRQPR